MDNEGFFNLHAKLCRDISTLPCNEAANAKRADLLLVHKYVAGRNPEWLASEFLENDLVEYASLIDDRKGVNNFAACTLELCSKLKKDCKNWKSSLPLSGPPNLKELLDKKYSECANRSENGCTAYLPSDKELDEFSSFMAQATHRTRTSKEFSSLAESALASNFQRGFDQMDHSFMPPTKTALAPHLPNRNPLRQHVGSQPHYSKDFKQLNAVAGFVAKRPQYLNTGSPEETRSHSFAPNNPARIPPLIPSGANRKPLNSFESNVDSNTYGAAGGVYFNRVGGRFKKWGGKEKSENSLESYDQEGPASSRTSDIFQSQSDASRGRNGGFVGGSGQYGGRGFPDDSAGPSHDPPTSSSFKTAGEQLRIETQRKFGKFGASYGGGGGSHETSLQGGYGHGPYHPAKFIKKSLGGKGVVNNRFVPPLKSNLEKKEFESPPMNSEEEEIDERLKNIEPRMIELIKNEIMDCGSKLTWEDIAGLHFAKSTIQEIVVWPMLRPDIFTGLRRPPKGILLFGPPGTGKTLIGKCIASQSGSTFFSISASSLTSKWIGEGEKMVRALFAVARVHQPAVVFIDEIDSLLSQRSETEHESSRRIKTEFLVQLDGAGTDEEDRLLVIGATNRPQELDEAARRRLVKRLYIPLPDHEARKEMIAKLMKSEPNQLSAEDIDEVAKVTEGFSGADMKHLCQEACLGPIRSLGPSQISSIAAHQVRPVDMSDFTTALKRVHPSVGQDDLHQYVAWNKTYGSGS